MSSSSGKETTVPILNMPTGKGLLKEPEIKIKAKKASNIAAAAGYK